MKRKLLSGSILFYLLIVMLGGCSDSPPRTRLGCLPCPGPFTLFALADPSDLGVARYEEMPRFFSKDEVGHGIIYTRRAGFLDMAHLRESIDWSWYASRHVETALRNKQTTLKLPGYDDCPFHLTFHYPADWDRMSEPRRSEIIIELSRRIGERVTLDAMAWHEIITWFGYKTSLIWSEKPSAFTYEDIMSHVIGVEAGDYAMRHLSGSWDQMATDGLQYELEKVGVVSKAEAARAVELVKGKWWAGGWCIRRMLDIGQNNDQIHPWLVRGAPGGDLPAPGFNLPTLHDVAGENFDGFYTMEIEPSLLIPSEIRRYTPHHAKRINPAIHFPYLVQQIRKEMRREFGPTFDQPYD